MANLLTRVLLFLSSYFPLSVIFFILLLEGNRSWAIGILATGTVGLLGMSLFLAIVRRLSPTTVKVAAVSRRDVEAMSYIVTYLVPFLTMPLADTRQAICTAIFFVVLGIIYVNSGMLHINPMLNLAGFHIYEVESSDGDRYSLVSKHKVRRGDDVSVVKIGDAVLMEANR